MASFPLKKQMHARGKTETPTTTLAAVSAGIF
jgi:hypothetical protein